MRSVWFFLELSPTAGGGQLETEELGIDVLETEARNIETFEMGRDDLQHVVDGVETALAAVALSAFE